MRSERKRASGHRAATRLVPHSPGGTYSAGSQRTRRLCGYVPAMRLEREQVDLLRRLAEAARAAPRDRRTFMVSRTFGGTVVLGESFKSEAVWEDVLELLA